MQGKLLVLNLNGLCLFVLTCCKQVKENVFCLGELACCGLKEI